MKKFSFICIMILLLTTISVGMAEPNPYYVIGTFQDNIYKNEFFGLGYQFTDWVFNEVNYEVIIAGLKSEASPVVVGESMNGYYSMAIGVLDSRIENCPATVEEVLYELADPFVHASINAGYKYTSPQLVITKLAGKDAVSCLYKGTRNNGTESAYIRAVAIKQDDYYMLVLCTSLNANKTDDMLSKFYVLKK